MALKKILTLICCCFLLAACTEEDHKLVKESFTKSSKAIGQHYEKQAKAEAKAVAKEKRAALAKKKAWQKAQKQKNKENTASAIAAPVDTTIATALAQQPETMESLWQQAQSLFDEGNYALSNEKIELIISTFQIEDEQFKKQLTSLQLQNNEMLQQVVERDEIEQVELDSNEPEQLPISPEQIQIFFGLDENAIVELKQKENDALIYEIYMQTNSNAWELIGIFDTSTNELKVPEELQ